MLSMTMQARSHVSNYRSLIALAAGALSIALAPIFVRVSDVEPIATAFYRLIFALPVLFLWLNGEERTQKLQTSKPRPKLRYGIFWLALAGFLLAADLAIWHISITLTSVANATVFNNCAPVFVTCFAWFFLRESISRRMIIALIIAIGGMAMMMAENLQFGGTHLKGDLMAITTGGFYGGYILVVKYLRRFYTTARIMALSTLAALPVLLFFTLVTEESLGPISLNGFLVLIALGLVCHVAGQSLIAFALAALPASFSSVGLLLQPVGAGILAWFLFGESQSALQIMGSFLVLSGIAVAPRNPQPARLQAAAP